MKKTKRRSQPFSEASNIRDDGSARTTSEDYPPFSSQENCHYDSQSTTSRGVKKSKSLDGFNVLMTALLKSGVESFNVERRRDEEGSNDINQMDKQGNIPLVLAAKQGWEDGVDFLLSQEEININLQTPDGQTALSVACAHGHSEIVKKLISRGSNILLEDKTESTAICYAVSREHENIAHYIYQQMSRECKNAFVKRRIELLSSPKAEGKNLFSFYNKILFPVLLDIKRSMEGGMVFLLENKVFSNLITCAERCHRDADMLCAVFRLLSCLIYSEEGDNNCVIFDLAEQFVQEKGPEIILKLIKCHSHEYSFQVRIAAMVAIQVVIEVEDGIECVKQNIMELIPLFVEFNSKVRVLNCWQEKERTKVCLMWKKFKDFFLKLCEKSGIRNIISEEQPYSNKGFKNIPKGQRRRNKQNINKPWGKISENPIETKRPEVIFDPLTKYNFGPCTQPMDEELGEFETVIHSKREKSIAKSKGTHSSRKNKQYRNNLDDISIMVRTNKAESQSGRRSSRTNSFICNKEESNRCENIYVRNLFATRVNPNTEEWLQQQRSFKGYPDAVKNDGEQEQKDVEDYLQQIQVGNDTSWADGISSSDFADNWKVSMGTNDERSPTPISPASYFDSDEYHAERESSDDEEIICHNVTASREETIGESNSLFDNKIDNVEDKPENMSSLSLPNSFVDVLVEVMTNMMKTLMKKCLYWPEDDSDFCEDSTMSKLKEQPNPQWHPQSHRWQSLLSEMVKVPKIERMVVHTVYYVEKEEYIIGRGRFLNYVGLTKESKEVAIKKFNLMENPQLLNQIVCSIKSSTIENKNILPITDVYLKNNWAFFIVELCECNLQEYLMLMGERSSLACIGKELISQLLEGFSYLHNHQPPIIHGSLRPTNILISLNGNLVLSNFGLLEIWPPPCGIIDRSLASHVSVTKCSWRPRECLVAVNTSMAKASYTTFSDMQLGGMVVHFILTRGSHPFGSNDIECQINIARGRPVYRYLGQEMNDMIGLMLSHDPRQRPMASMALKHPYFWYSEKRLNFLIAVASQPEMTTDSPDVQHLLSSPALYFTDRFPSLVVTIYKVIRESCWKDRTSLSGYF